MNSKEFILLSGKNGSKAGVRVVDIKSIDIVSNTPQKTIVSTYKGDTFIINDTPEEVLNKIIATERHCFLSPFGVFILGISMLSLGLLIGSIFIK